MPQLLKAARGIMLACAVTMTAMALMALGIAYGGWEAERLGLINQLIKALSVALGVFFAVGRGGERGLVTGAIVGMAFILIGYGVYVLTDGRDAGAGTMALEAAAGAVVGAVSGIAAANMKKPAGRRKGV